MPLIAAASGRRVRQMRKRSMFFLKTPYLCDLDTARYKGRLQSRNPGMTGISLPIDQHTKQ
jgi:hypothetical protein